MDRSDQLPAARRPTTAHGTGDGFGDWSGDGLGHEAFFFDDHAQVVDRCGPFVEEGLDLHQPVLVVASDGVRAALRERLGPSIGQSLAAFEPAETWWRGPHETMAAYFAVLAPLRAAGTPWRLVAEPVWLDSGSGRYWSRFEAVANVALADFPYYSMCLHDHRRLDDATRASVRCTHPRVVDATDPTVSSSWQGAAEFLTAVEPEPLPRPGTAAALEHSTLRTVRAQARAACTDAGLAQDRTNDVVVAIDELAANALAVDDHVTISTWRQGDRLVIEVRDHGPGFDDPLAGYVVPPTDGERGRGLWLARALTDDLAIRSTPAGTIVQAFVDVR